MESIKTSSKPIEFKVPALPKKNNCNYCEKVFERRSELIKHSKEHGEFICKFCDSKFRLEKQLTNHKCPFCKICKRNLKTFQAFRTHMMCSHNIKPTDLFECDLCGLLTSRKHVFSKHIENHSKGIVIKSNRKNFPRILKQ